MRLTFAGAVIAAPLLLSSAPSTAQTIYPWCLKALMGEDYTVDLCYFQTFERCAQERIAYGTSSFCIVNPHYYFRYGEPGQTPRKRGRDAR
ncbi:MAG TPA: DUF3551 domain-containing protein [Xanthobacteraceae bacterium]|nr:DUF3551 domain-containing protein [Xanthobacteraceae bacterium]